MSVDVRRLDLSKPAPPINGARRSMSRRHWIVLALLIGVLMPPQLDEAIAAPNGPTRPTLRTGTVLATPKPTGTICWVQFAPGEDPAGLPFLNPYVPMAGDQVQVLFDATPGGSMSGIVLGGRAGQSGNRVLNPDFATINPILGPPAGWSAYNASGAAANVIGFLTTGHETPVMNINVTSNAANDNYVYSAAWPVSPGERYRMDATGTAFSVNPSITIELRALWFASATDEMPTQISTTLADSINLGAGGIDFGLGDGVNFPQVPDGAKFMRAAVRVIHSAGAGGNYRIYVYSVQAYKA